MESGVWYQRVIHKVTTRKLTDGTSISGVTPKILKEQIAFYRRHPKVILVSEGPLQVTFLMPAGVKEECDKALNIKEAPMPANDQRGVNC